MVYPTCRVLTVAEAIAELRAKPSVDVVVAGRALDDLSRDASYRAVSKGQFSVPVFKIRGRLRVASADVLGLLGLAADRQPTGAAKSSLRRQMRLSRRQARVRAAERAEAQ